MSRRRRGGRRRRDDQAGAAVVIGDIREDLGQATADEIKKSGGDAAFLPLMTVGSVHDDSHR